MTAYFACAAGLIVAASCEAGAYRLEFTAVLPVKSGLTVSFGRGRESLAVTSGENGYNWTYRDAEGVDQRTRRIPGSSQPTSTGQYWWEKPLYSPNGRYKRTFDLPENVFLWSEYLFTARYKTAAERTLAFAVEYVDGRLAFYVDNILLHSVKATADLDWRKASVKGSGEAKVSEVANVPVQSTPGYYRVPFGEVATLEANPVGSPRTVGGVPFLGAAKSVELSKSWVREAAMDEYGEPCNGAFGGRWAGALSCNPCRLQFVVPNVRYDAMYMLASCRGANALAVQFYRPSSGFPVAFVPAEEIAADGDVHLVKIPLHQVRLANFKDRETVEFELVARENVYRSTPEPCHVSKHGGGAPSDVKVHAITLHEADTLVDFEPTAFGNVWVGMDPKPSYDLVLANRSATNRVHSVRLATRSYDGSDVTDERHDLSVAAGGRTEARLDVPVRKFGWHKVELTVDGTVYERSLVVLRPREYKKRPFDAPGHMFGTWPPGSAHWSLPFYDACRLTFPLGIDAFPFGNGIRNDTLAFNLAKKYGISDFLAITDDRALRDPDEPKFADTMESLKSRPNEVVSPAYAFLFPEWGGIGETYVLPEFYGEKREPRTPEQEQRYQKMKKILIGYAKAFREKCPGCKLLVPWGSPAVSIAFLEDPETREYVDGMAYDNGQFDRLPEGLLGQCSLYGMYSFNEIWRKYRKDKPAVITIEGPCLSRVAPGSLTERESLDHYLRCVLILSANGVTRHLSSLTGTADGQSYWGEQHYNSGAFTGTTLNPYPTYAGEGTLVRHLRDAEFVRAVPTANLGLFNLEYRNVKTGKTLNVLWCIRGRIPFTAKAAAIFDAMDNTPLKNEVTTTPIFVYGAKDGFTFGQQVFDEADANSAADSAEVADLAEWTQVVEPGEDGYLNSFPADVRRFPCEMSVSNCAGKLSVALRDDSPDRGIMPVFTTLVPPRPVTLPGRPAKLALETTAVSDWGRVVFVLEDAKGERFISVGGKGVYNCDDTPYASYFTFEGRRMIRQELPVTHPWDGFRGMGYVWWGHSGGDGVVDYPLSVVKVHVERRTRVLHANELVEAPRGPVLLGRLYAEEIDRTDSPRMPLPPKAFKPVNPLAEIKGTLSPTKITGIRKPEHYYDGTRGHFDFDEVEGAAGYDIYVSTSENGDGAILLGKNIRASGTLVNGFRPNRDNFAFIVWRDKKGNVSVPSAPFKFRTVDEFSNK